MEKLFEQAVREKVRFCYKGLCTCEALYDMPLPALDDIYKKLRREQKEQAEESLLNSRTPESKRLELKLALVEYVVKTRISENEAKVQAIADQQRNEKIKAIIEQKKDQQLLNMSIEELEKLQK